MNPWGTMNDWLRLDADERVRTYGRVRQTQRTTRRKRLRAVPVLRREDVTT